MSNILRTKEDIGIFNDFFHEVDAYGIRAENINELLSVIIPRNEKGKPLIRHNVREKGMQTAMFSPKFEDIQISVNKLREWLNKNYMDIGELYGIKDTEKLRNYLLLFVMTHELEHGYQYLMGTYKYPAPCPLVSQSYKGLCFLLVTPTYILPRPITLVRRTISLIKYKQQENELLLERNANVEAFDLLSKLAKTNGDEELYDAFLKMKNGFLKLGYLETGAGSISETYQKILMADKYRKMKKDNNLSMEEKVHYGLEIDEETRTKVLKLPVK